MCLLLECFVSVLIANCEFKSGGLLARIGDVLKGNNSSIVTISCDIQVCQHGLVQVDETVQ
jgi:hypothetical protein